MVELIDLLKTSANKIKEELAKETRSVGRRKPDPEAPKLVEKVSDKLSDAKKVVQTGFDSYWKWKKDEKAIIEVDQVIEEEKGKIETYKNFEDFIYETLRPMLGKGGLADELNDIASKLEKKNPRFRWISKGSTSKKSSRKLN